MVGALCVLVSSIRRTLKAHGVARTYAAHARRSHQAERKNVAREAEALHLGARAQAILRRGGGGVPNSRRMYTVKRCIASPKWGVVGSKIVYPCCDYATSYKSCVSTRLL